MRKYIWRFWTLLGVMMGSFVLGILVIRAVMQIDSPNVGEVFLCVAGTLLCAILTFTRILEAK